MNRGKTKRIHRGKSKAGIRRILVFMIAAATAAALISCALPGKSGEREPAEEDSYGVQREEDGPPSDRRESGTKETETETGASGSAAGESPVPAGAGDGKTAQDPASDPAARQEYGQAAAPGRSETGPAPAFSPENVSMELPNTLIIGDSRTEGLMLYSGLKGVTYYCKKSLTLKRINDREKLTIGGATYSLPDLLAGGSYERIVVCVGLNELGWKYIQDFLDQYGILIDTLQAQQPQAQVYLQSILPVTADKSAKDPTHNNEKITWFNTEIYKLSQEKGVGYIDPSPAVIDETYNLDPAATTDGIHLKSEYCRRWGAFLAEHLA